jgi:exopolysaccharide biosynthesis polyprenyl glycosylphosphotransferase
MRISKHKLLLAGADVFIISAGFGLAFWFVFSSGLYGGIRPVPVYFVPSLVLLAIIFVSAFQLEGLYKYQAVANPIHQLQKLFKCYLRVFGTFIVLVFFMKTEYIADSRLTIGLGFLISFLALALFRVNLVPRVFRFMVARRFILKRVAIIGSGEHGRAVLKHWSSNSLSYFKIMGFLDDDPSLKEKMIEGMEVLGTSRDIGEIAARYHLAEAVIAISNIEKKELLEIIDRCRNAGLSVHVISTLFSKVNEKLEAEQYGGLTTYRLETRENGAVRAAVKSAFDLSVSAVLLILLAPVFGILAWAIKHDSKGRVFYRSDVVGRNEKIFKAYKFRTMFDRDCADEKEKRLYETGYRRHLEFMKDFIQGRKKDEFFFKNEPRLTKVGRFLRKYSLDELPQLINVFRGQMSLVGPRFCSPAELKFYEPWQKRRFQVKPGITGLWQVRARSEVSYDDMIMMDLYYIQNRSFFFDLEILLRTISVVLTGKGSRIK